MGDAGEEPYHSDVEAHRYSESEAENEAESPRHSHAEGEKNMRKKKKKKKGKAKNFLGKDSPWVLCAMCMVVGAIFAGVLVSVLPALHIRHKEADASPARAAPTIDDMVDAEVYLDVTGLSFYDPEWASCYDKKSNQYGLDNGASDEEEPQKHHVDVHIPNLWKDLRKEIGTRSAIIRIHQYKPEGNQEKPDVFAPDYEEPAEEEEE